jgi:hypothetical protein
MAKLVQVSPTGPRNFTSVDEDGVVWRGEIKTYKAVESASSGNLFPRSFRQTEAAKCRLGAKSPAS